MNYHWTFCLASILAFVSPSTSAPASFSAAEESFENFLELAMLQFPNWLRSNNLDPTPTDVVDLTVNTGNVKLTGNLTNLQLSGHSNITNFTTSQNFNERDIAIMVPMENYSVDGLYSLEGISYDTPIKGRGQFHFNDENQYSYTNVFILGIFDFGITPEGYIDITVAEKATAPFGNFEGVFNFSDLDGGENDRWLKYYLKEKFDVQWSTWYPVPDLLFRYLDELFKVTPVSDIINGTATAGYQSNHYENRRNTNRGQAIAIAVNAFMKRN